MQSTFAFVTHDLAEWRDRLRIATPVVMPSTRRTPIGQLVKSLISGRTQDPVSLAAYARLGNRYPDPAALAQANPADVTKLIADVTFPETKAAHLVAALQRIERACEGFSLDFLKEWPLDAALAWLERLPGVAGKVAASTLNASTLDRPVMIVDSHVLRVMVRLGFADRRADFGTASRAVTAALPGWTGTEFFEFHMLMKRLGQKICRFDAPLCGQCPLIAHCPAATMTVSVRHRVATGRARHAPGHLRFRSTGIPRPAN